MLKNNWGEIGRQAVFFKKGGIFGSFSKGAG